MTRSRIAREVDDILARPPSRSACEPVMFHGSQKPLPVGKVLQARTNRGWFPAPIEDAMESGRPSGMPSRLSSFFLVSDRKHLRSAGASTNHVYRVTPIGECSKHHHGWMGNVYDAMIPFVRHRAPQEEKDAATSRLAHLDEWIHNYWTGVPYSHRSGQANEVWEFLAPEIRVEERV